MAYTVTHPIVYIFLLSHWSAQFLFCVNLLHFEMKFLLHYKIKTKNKTLFKIKHPKFFFYLHSKTCCRTMQSKQR